MLELWGPESRRRKPRKFPGLRGPFSWGNLPTPEETDEIWVEAVAASWGWQDREQSLKRRRSWVNRSHSGLGAGKAATSNDRESEAGSPSRGLEMEQLVWNPSAHGCLTGAKVNVPWRKIT